MRRTPFRSLQVVLLLTAVLAVLAAAPAAAGDAQGEQEVQLTAEGFAPASLRVPQGEEVTWVNASGATQTLLGEEGSWDSGPLRPGESFSVVLRVTGTFRYGTADGAAEGVLEVVPPIEDADAAPERPAADPSRTLADTGPASGVLLASSGALLLAGVLLLRLGGRRVR